jgi:aryl-alcohol dehydrogenase-like predicted oxidoreductase
MKTRKLGTDLTVSAVGLGCMGMSFAYGGQAEADAIATLHRAVDIGVNFFDTAEVYGPFDNEILLGKALKPCATRSPSPPNSASSSILEEGAGLGRMIGVDSRPEHVKAVAEASLKRLGTDVIDLFYQHRVDPNVPIEDTVGAMAELVREGKVRALGLSEARVRDHPPGPCRAPDRRRAERVFAVEPRSGKDVLRHLPRTRHRLRAL